MRLRNFVIAAVLGVVFAAASIAVASNVHLKGGPSAEPTFTDQGLTLNAQGDLTGLGQEQLKVTLTATGNPTAICTNPSGKQQPPGQNPAEVTLTGVQTINPNQIDKNGNAHFNVTTAAPTSPIPSSSPDFSCPGANWTETITDVAFTTARITVEQPPGTTVLTINCTFSSPTSNGTVPGSNVSCTQS
jgi:hypothetical protein